MVERNISAGPSCGARLYGAAVLHRAAGKYVIAINDDIDLENADAHPVGDVVPGQSDPRYARCCPTATWATARAAASGNNGEDASVLIDATLKEDFPPISLPKREYMEKAKKIWEELGLPKLKRRSAVAHEATRSANGRPPTSTRAAELAATRGDYFATGKRIPSSAAARTCA